MEKKYVRRLKRFNQGKIILAFPETWKTFFDRSIYVIGVIGPAMTIPQLLKICIEQNAAGVSLIMWVTYLFIAIFWIIYGVIHKVKAIVFSYIIWIILDILIIAGIIWYG